MIKPLLRILPTLASLALGQIVAQQVVMQPVPLAPLSTTATVGSSSNTATSPLAIDILGTSAGPGGGAITLLRTLASGSDTMKTFGTQHSLGVSAGAVQPVLATCETDVALQLSATSAANVFVQVRNNFSGSAGAPLPLVEIDIGNDGFFEYSTAVGAGAGVGPFPLSLGPTPIPVRVHVRSILAVDGNSNTDVAVEIAPLSPSIDIHTAVAGCDSWVASFGVALRFDGGVDFGTLPLPDPVVMVLGLAAQPAVLGFNGILPCLVIPAPDLLVVPTSNVFTLPLPAAVRPVTIWAQAVRLSPLGLLTTNALRVDAP